MTDKESLDESEVPISDLSKGQMIYKNEKGIFFVEQKNNEKPCLQETEVSVDSLSKEQSIMIEGKNCLYFVDEVSPKTS